MDTILPVVCIFLMLGITVFGSSSSSKYYERLQNTEDDWEDNAEDDGLIDMCGCGFLNNDYNLPNNLSIPQWGNPKKISVLELNLDQQIALNEILQNIINNLYKNTFNTISNYIDFYDAYAYSKSEGISFSDFFDNYEVKKSYGVNLNIELMETILQDQDIENLFPTLKYSIFLAATVQNMENKLIKKMDVNRFKKYNHFKHAIVAIKISYPEDNTIKQGFMFLDVESYLPNIWISGLFKISSRKGKSKKGKLKESDCYNLHRMFNSKGRNDFVCPIRVIEIPETTRSNTEVELSTRFGLALKMKESASTSGESQVLEGLTYQHASIHFKPLHSEEDFIYSKVVDPRLNDVEGAGSIIYVGRPYCSFMETTEKYKLLSPYRTFVRRGSPDYDTPQTGIFVNVQKNIEDFIIFHSDGYTKRLGTTVEKYFTGRKVPFNTFNETNLSRLYDAYDLMHRLMKYTCIGLGIQTFESLLEIIHKMESIIKDETFIDDVENYLRNK